MKLSAIANTLLTMRNQATVYLHSSQMQEALGPDGYSYALNHNWIVADHESGGLAITNNGNLLEELAKLAFTEKKTAVVQESRPDHYRMFATNVQDMVYVESKDGDVIEAESCEVGDNVTVGEEGKSYTGVVKSKNPDGTYDLSFNDRNKPRTPKKYRPEEVKKVAKTVNPAPAVVPATAR